MKLSTSQRLTLDMANLQLRSFKDNARRGNDGLAIQALNVAVAELTRVRDELSPQNPKDGGTK